MADIDTFSSWLDARIGARLDGMTEDDLRAELLMMHRTIKAAEEVGESVAALIGMTGANPRKGSVGGRADLVNELLDVAVSALGAVEHLCGNDGSSLRRLKVRIDGVVTRAGLSAEPGDSR